MVRFFVAPQDITGGSVHLNPDDAAHIRSLRLRPGELFTVCDGEGLDYICHLGMKGDSSIASVIESHPSPGEPSVDCTVYIAFAKGDRLDYAVQKCVELGAYGVVLYPSARCVSVLGDSHKKTARLQRIALETAKQCGRGRVPVVSAVGSFEEAVDSACGGLRSGNIVEAVYEGSLASSEAPGHLDLFCYEEEKDRRLKQALDEHFVNTVSSSRSIGQCYEAATGATWDIGAIRTEGAIGVIGAVSVMTGPEGGFEPSEASYAVSAGMVAVSLGPRILRCETAPVAALAAVMFCTGNM